MRERAPTSFGQGSPVLHRGSCAEWHCFWTQCPKPWNTMVLAPTLAEREENGLNHRTAGGAEAAGKTSR